MGSDLSARWICQASAVLDTSRLKEVQRGSIAPSVGIVECSCNDHGFTN